MRTPLVQRIARRGLVALLVIAPFMGCASSGEEGDACDRDNGNDDCENGLICRAAWEVQADEAVCCPRPPAKPSTDACKPELEHHVPDPSIDGSFGSGGSGTGGSGGSGGVAGTGGDASTTDAPADSTSTGGAAGAGGTSGASGTGGDGGKAGKDGGKPDGG